MRAWIGGPVTGDIEKEYVATDLLFLHRNSPEFKQHFDEFIQHCADRLYNRFTDEELLEAIRETEESARDRLNKLKLVVGRFRAFSRALCERLTPEDKALMMEDKGGKKLLDAAGHDLTSLIGEALAHWHIENADPILVNPPKEHTTLPGIDFMEFFDTRNQRSVRVWEVKTVVGEQMAPHCTEINNFFMSTIFNSIQDTFKSLRRELPQPLRDTFRWQKGFLPGDERFHYGVFFVISHETERSPYLAYKKLTAPSMEHRHLVVLTFPDLDFAQLTKAVGQVGDQVCTRILRDLS